MFNIRRRVTVVLGVSSLLAGAAVGAGSSEAGAAVSAQSLYQASIANLSAATGVHLSSRSTVGGLLQTTVGDAGTTSGSQTVVVNFGKGKIGRAQFKLVDGTVYFTANSTFYTQTGITSSVPPAGAWLSMTSSDKNYVQAASGLTVSSVASEIGVQGPYSYKGAARVGRVKAVVVLGVSSQTTASGSTSKVPTTVTIGPSSKPVPLAEAINSSKEKASLFLTRYGETVVVTAPSSSAPASQYGG